MRLPLAHFFAHTSRTHMSMARETDLTRHMIESWLTEGNAVYVYFDKRTEVISRIVEEPPPKIRYERKKK